MNKDLIQKTESFLKDTFQKSPFLTAHPEQLHYRLEHSFRVANIGRQLAEAEGFDTTAMVIACLLHDISYCEQLTTRQQRLDHGRRAAQIARPFLQTLALPGEQRNDILYGIAIHADGTADFEWRHTAFAETVSDADNIDRFDAYRIYETLEYNHFSGLSLAEKQQHVCTTLEKLPRLREMALATPTAQTLWKEKIDFQNSFYRNLLRQLECSEGIV